MSRTSPRAWLIKNASLVQIQISETRADRPNHILRTEAETVLFCEYDVMAFLVK